MTPKEKDSDSWDVYQKLILAQLDTMSRNLGTVNGAVEKLSDKVGELQVDVAKLTVGAGSIDDVKASVVEVKTSVGALSKLVQDVNREVGELQVKSGLMGAITGAISGTLIILGKVWKFGG
jgi:methyl-accepting chemotaxis protein